MEFIRLHQHYGDGREIHINIRHITTVYTDEDGLTNVTLINGGGVVVSETVEKILETIDLMTLI